MSNQAPKFIDLFAGCGGLSLGLETAGFSPMFVNELSPQAMDTYLSNRRAHHPQLDRFNVNDVKELVLSPHRLEDLADGLKREYGVDVSEGELDLIAGGPPCQGFSGIGHRRSYSVAREQLPSNHLYQDMAHVIHKLRPKMFLFENVEGLIRGRWTPGGTKGEIWEDVLETFRGIPGYSVRFKLVHARDYGVPQNRPRVLLVGVRSDQPFFTEDEGDAVGVGYLPAPMGSPAPGIEAIWSDLVDPAYQPGGETTAYPSDPMNEWQERFRLDPRTGKLLGKGAPVTEHEYSRHSSHVVAKFQHMIENDGMMLEHMKTKKFAQRVLPREWGPKGATITATSLPDDYVHYSQPRVPTVREWARLQTFPDWYQFKGKRTTGGLRRAGNPRIGLHEREVPKYTQIGNAVPVNLAAAVGAHFKALLER